MQHRGVKLNQRCRSWSNLFNSEASLIRYLKVVVTLFGSFGFLFAIFRLDLSATICNQNHIGLCQSQCKKLKVQEIAKKQFQREKCLILGTDAIAFF